MMLKLSSKEVADYVELINSYLDKNPCIDITDFDDIIRMLSSVDATDDSVEVPEHLRDYIENIRELLESPEDYASKGHHHVFVEKVTQRKKAKVEELSAMSREERMHLIAQTRLDEMERHLGQVEMQRKQLPREFLELPSPNLFDQLSADQLAALDHNQREILANANISRLVACGKLSLDKLLHDKPFIFQFLLENSMLNLFISGVVNEELYYSLTYCQQAALAEYNFTYELMRSGAMTLERVISLNGGERIVLNSNIIACCIKLNLITIDEALKIPLTRLSNLEENRDKILNRVMTISEALNQGPIFRYI